MSGGPSAPGSYCASCARREKERADPGLEAGEGPGAAGCGPGRGREVLRSWPGARETGLAPDCVRGPGGFRREECDRLKGLVWARGRGTESNGLGWRPRGCAGGLGAVSVETGIVTAVHLSGVGEVSCVC